MWRLKIRALLMHQCLLKVFFGNDKLPKFVSEDAKEEIEMKVHGTIQIYQADEVLRVVANEDTTASLWLKLDRLYMCKFLTNKLNKNLMHLKILILE